MPVPTGGDTRFHPEPVGPSYLTDEQRQAIRELGFPRGDTEETNS
jgi:hypothetical protein